MRHSYYYLIASLPMLEFGMKLPFSCDEFLNRCEEHLSIKDLEILKNTRLREWEEFDLAIRNELVKSRAGKLSKDPAKYVRGEHYSDPFIAGFTQWLLQEDSPMEAEIALDKFRWDKIEEIAAFHYFDVEFLAAYALKLKILERWNNINNTRGMEILKEMVEREAMG